MDRGDIKEKIIIIGITTGVFLPVRLLFTSFVSDNWFGSLGVISVLGIIFLVLIKREKLGWFGKIFEKQLKKTIAGKTGRYIIAISIIFLIYFGSGLFFIERGSTIFSEDKEIFLYAIQGKESFSMEDIPIEKLNGPQDWKGFDSISQGWFSKIDYVLSISYGVLDDTTGGWLSHFVAIVFVEQLEVIGLLYFYRKSFKSEKPKVGYQKEWKLAEVPSSLFLIIIIGAFLWVIYGIQTNNPYILGVNIIAIGAISVAFVLNVKKKPVVTQKEN